MTKKSGRIYDNKIIENARKKIRDLGITEKDIREAIIWARKK